MPLQTSAAVNIVEKLAQCPCTLPRVLYRPIRAVEALRNERRGKS